MTVQNLRPKTYAKAIEAIGYASIKNNAFRNRYWEVNDSSILTKLIQDTGRFAEHYASDLFIGWKEIDAYISNGTDFSHTWYFGIREMGVDSAMFINSHLKDKQYTDDYYRKIYRLTADVSDDKTQITLTLVEVG